MNFEFEKKEALARVEQVKKDEINRSEKKKQLIVIVLVSCVLVVVIVFAVFISRNLRTTRKQKVIIEEQKAIVEEKHKEITDSINYAERIQRSFLATKEMLDKNLSPNNTDNYFVLFKPRDVVSGDFYWATALPNGDFMYVTADSTGHGVPGAIMSILNISSLEKAVEKYTNPHEILNTTRQIIIDRLKKDGSTQGGKDGMDCSLVILDKNRKQLRYSASNNPLWIMRNQQLIEFAFDKMPVGRHDSEHVSFTSHNVELQPGDVIYTFTDGLPDQFGGPKGKKFKYTRLKEVLAHISTLPMRQQQQELQNELVQWMGILEQIDDVCVIGVRI
ncbi:MAG: PP2C family protein-serine/threonine phosphatase [Flavobacteriales bacterium]